MKLRTRSIGFETGGLGVVILNKADVARLGIHSLDRVIITKGKKKMVGVVDVSEKFASEGEVITSEEITESMKLRLG